MHGLDEILASGGLSFSTNCPDSLQPQRLSVAMNSIIFGPEFSIITPTIENSQLRSYYLSDQLPSILESAATAQPRGEHSSAITVDLPLHSHDTSSHPQTPNAKRMQFPSNEH